MLRANVANLKVNTSARYRSAKINKLVFFPHKVSSKDGMGLINCLGNNSLWFFKFSRKEKTEGKKSYSLTCQHERGEKIVASEEIIDCEDELLCKHHSNQVLVHYFDWLGHRDIYIVNTEVSLNYFFCHRSTNGKVSFSCDHMYKKENQ